jgi:hypothetical protein
MALYKTIRYLSPSNDAAFDQIHHPGNVTPHSGIYRCEGCGLEIVSEHPKVFPPQHAKAHTSAQGAIRWQLIVYAVHQT